jgi:hypothetical protein
VLTTRIVKKQVDPASAWLLVMKDKVEVVLTKMLSWYGHDICHGMAKVDGSGHWPTVVSGCGYEHERHSDVPRFEALVWR